MNLFALSFLSKTYMINFGLKFTIYFFNEESIRISGIKSGF